MIWLYVVALFVAVRMFLPHLHSVCCMSCVFPFLFFLFCVCIFPLAFPYNNHNPCIIFLLVPFVGWLTCRPCSQFANPRSLFAERRHVLTSRKNTN